MPRARKPASDPTFLDLIREKADRYFAEQCARLGPIDPKPGAARRGSAKTGSRVRQPADPERHRRLAIA